MSVFLSEHMGRDKTQQSGVVCNRLSRPACRTSVSLYFSFPCLSACCHKLIVAAEATSTISWCVQELLALPAITPAILQKFEADVAATGSEKEQRFIIRKLLMQSGMHMPFNMCLAWG